MTEIACVVFGVYGSAAQVEPATEPAKFTGLPICDWAPQFAALSGM
jgi:hypothetical protein